MALRQLLLGRRIDEQRARKAALETAREALAARRTDMRRREAELEASIGEVTEQTPPEDRDALDALTAEYEADEAALSDEEAQNARDREQVEAEITRLQAELDALNARAQGGAAGPSGGQTQGQEQRRTEDMQMETRTGRRMFGTMQEREAFFARADVRAFLSQVREMGRQKRDVTGAGVLVPGVVLDILRENVQGYSKLYRHVRVRQVGGTARQPVSGPYVEAVWTEQCGGLNELGLNFSAFEFDGYKVGGYIAVCNATLEDADPVLGQEIIVALGQAIGLALDKAILYGTGVKMPLGILPRLAQTAAPENYPANARPWADLHATHITAITGKTGLAFFQAILAAAAKAKGRYSRGEKFFAMNELTYSTLMAEAMSINAAGAIVTGVQGVMPVVGGAVEVLDFIPDNVIIGGYGDLYTLTERAGTRIEWSREARFEQDETVYRGVARYDGKPVIAEGFVAIGIAGNTPSATAVTFSKDAAGDRDASLSALTLGSLTLTPAFDPAVTQYTATTTNASNTVTASAKKPQAVIAITNGETPVTNGQSATWQSGENTLTVNVQYGTSAMTYTVRVNRTGA